ncbi:hypothetical protein BV898_02549 [Hypsibius exemplaris]|uniref:Uncharacterized protein n=1 Tax=Hypsibius exemplaris TaxID=2072580 RepID=A0A1W0X7C0_HYPEX|nr:hypothetical protein BV898_02549 [Hypsibius exemplaris]
MTILQWVMLFMVIHPNVQAKVQEDLVRVIGPQLPRHNFKTGFAHSAVPVNSFISTPQSYEMTANPRN